jgi:hypothetical protein
MTFLNGAEFVNERLLFHGTGNTKPSVIYEGVVGFDVRCTSEGNFYGRGVYFAESASYVEGPWIRSSVRCCEYRWWQLVS